MPIGSPATRTGRQYPEPANLRRKKAVQFGLELTGPLQHEEATHALPDDPVEPGRQPLDRERKARDKPGRESRSF